MNYTFFIGNGFDLGMGLKTRYSDFLDCYNRLRTTDTELDESRHWLIEAKLENPSQWSDLELALGQLTQKFITKQSGRDHDGLNRFFRFHADILIQLNKYLKREQQKLVLSSSSQMCNDFLSALHDLLKTLLMKHTNRLSALSLPERHQTRRYLQQTIIPSYLLTSRMFLTNAFSMHVLLLCQEEFNPIRCRRI